MQNTIKTFVESILERMDAFTMVSTAMDCCKGHLIRFIGNDSIHVWPNPKDNRVMSVCEVFSTEGVVEYIGVVERNGCICTVRGKVEELPEDEISKIMGAVLEYLFGSSDENVRKTPSEMLKWLVMEYALHEISNYASIGEVVERYPKKTVGEWVWDYDTQNYLEECKELAAEEDE